MVVAWVVVLDDTHVRGGSDSESMNVFSNWCRLFSADTRTILSVTVQFAGRK